MLDFDAHVEVHHPGRLAVAADGGANPFGRGQVEQRVHRVAVPKDIAAVLDTEFLKRDNRHGVFDGSARQGVLPVQDHVALRCVLEREVAATDQVDVAGLILAQVDIRLHHRVDTDGHEHIHAA